MESLQHTQPYQVLTAVSGAAPGTVLHQDSIILIIVPPPSPHANERSAQQAAANHRDIKAIVKACSVICPGFASCLATGSRQTFTSEARDARRFWWGSWPRGSTWKLSRIERTAWKVKGHSVFTIFVKGGTYSDTKDAWWNIRVARMHMISFASIINAYRHIDSDGVHQDLLASTVMSSTPKCNWGTHAGGHILKCDAYRFQMPSWHPSRFASVFRIDTNDLQNCLGISWVSLHVCSLFVHFFHPFHSSVCIQSYI